MICMLIFDLLLVVVVSLLVGVVVFVCGCLIVILLFETWWFGWCLSSSIGWLRLLCTRLLHSITVVVSCLQ